MGGSTVYFLSMLFKSLHQVKLIMKVSASKELDFLVYVLATLNFYQSKTCLHKSSRLFISFPQLSPM